MTNHHLPREVWVCGCGEELATLAKSQRHLLDNPTHAATKQMKGVDA